eukprot:m.39155 g.39155  ORF g.39155 m.39155 type:complete len:246 (+) comp11243_c0_seq1:44-781(+)
MSKLEFVSPEGLRLDGRRVSEIRRVKVRLGHSSAGDGSAYIEQGNTKVLATVYGPHEAVRSKLDHDKVVLNCEYSVAPFATSERRQRSTSDKRNVEQSVLIRSALEGTIITALYPRAQIDVFVQVLQADGGTLAASINAATLALMDAGVAMQDFVCACTAGHVDGMTILDLNQQEAAAQGPDLTVAYCSKTEQVVLSQMTSRVHAEHFGELQRLAIMGCSTLAAIFNDVVASRVAELLPSLGPAG